MNENPEKVFAKSSGGRIAASLDLGCQLLKRILGEAMRRGKTSSAQCRGIRPV